ncbi:MAG: NUDIX domain-containing protein [Mangrovibacterium sp.]
MDSAIPPVQFFRYCPRCGSANFNQLGDRAKKCVQCGFTYYFNTSAAVAALIFDPQGRLMFARRAIQPHLGMLDLPGGFIEPMETAEEAICRELKEELGVTVQSLEYFGSFPNEYPYSGISVFTLDLTFRVTVVSLENMVPMDDVASIEFYYPHEVDLSEVPSNSIRLALQKLQEK